MKKPVWVTDHALVRVLERVGGFEIERLRREIARKVQAAVDAGAGAVVIDGYAYIIGRADDRGPAVTTVLKVNPEPQRHVPEGDR
jgi:hypothetical protein